MSDRDVRKLAKIVADHSRQIKGLSGGPQAAYSSIEGGSMDSYDSDGKLRLRIGAQDDGTQGVKYVQGPPPPRPTAPSVSVDGPVVRVRWDGMLLGGHIPEDFARIDVHFALASDDLEADEAVRGNLATSAGNETVLAATETGTYRVGLVAMSQSRARSEMSETVDVDVTLVDIEGALDAVVENARGGSNYYSPDPPSGTDHDPDRDLWFDTSVDAEGLVSYSPHRWDADLLEWVSVADQRTAALQDALGDFEGTVEQRFTDAGDRIDGLHDSLINLDETTLPSLRQDLAAAEGRLGEAEQDITDAFGGISTAQAAAAAARRAAERALASASNLTPDGSAEVDSLDDFFTSSPTGDFQLVTDAASAYQGKRFIRYTHSTSAAGEGYLADTPNVVEGRTYRVTIAARLVSGTAGGSNGGYAPLWINANGSSVNLSEHYAKELWQAGGMIGHAGDGWQTFSGYVTPPPGRNVVRLRPRLYFTTGALSDGAVLDMDAITVQDVTEAKAALDAAADADANAQGYADAARQAAIDAAALDATAKAEAAEAAAAATAATDAQARADAAQAAAEEAARAYAEAIATGVEPADLDALRDHMNTKAEQAKQAAIDAAALDATAKAEAAEARAAIEAARVAQEKADAAEQAAKDAAAADATAKMGQARQEAIDAAMTEIDAVEGTLQSSIDAKRDITWSTSSPPTVYNGPVGSTWFKMSGNGSGAQVESQWRWNGDVWVSTILSSAVLAKIDIGAGTFGSLSGLRLEAGSITTDKVLVGAGRNIIPWGQVLAGASTAPHRNEDYYGAGVLELAPADAATGSPPHMVHRRTTSDPGVSRIIMYFLPRPQQFGALRGTDGFAVTGGKWRYSLTAYTAVQNMSVRLSVTAYNAQGGWAAAFSSAPKPVGAQKTKVDLAVDLPESAAYIVLYVRSDQPGDLHIVNPELTQMVGGTLVEPGGIQTPHLAADVLEVGNLKAGVGEITELVSRKIAAATGQFLELDVGQLTVTEQSKLADVVAEQIAADTAQFMELEVGKLVASEGILDEAVIKQLFAEVVVSQMSFADSFIGGNAILEGSITAESGIIGSLDLGVAIVGKLHGQYVEAGSIDTEQLAFGAATGDVLSVDALNFKTAVGLDIRGSSFRAGDAVEMTEDFGIRQFGPDGALNVSLPSDGSPAEFRGDLSARTLTATGRMSIQGPGAIASGGVLELESGVVPPVAGPQITNVWDRTTFPPLTDQEAPAGLAWAEGHFWRCVTTSVGLSEGGRTRIEKITPTGELAGGWDTTFRVGVDGITILNGELYILAAGRYLDMPGSPDRAVIVYDLQGVEQRRWADTGWQNTGWKAGIGNDGTNIVRVQSGSTGILYLNYYDPVDGTRRGTDSTGNVMRSDVTQILYGNFDYGDGPKRIVAQQRTDLKAFVCYDAAPTSPDDVARSWNAADFQNPVGLAWDGARFHSLTATGDLVSYQSHETDRFIGDDEDDWWGAVTWATGSQETTAGPATRFRYLHRAQLRVQNGDVPAGVEAARFYTSKGTSEPARTDLYWRATSEQPHEPLRVTSISSFSGGTNPPATNTFTADTPGEIHSALGNFRVDGSGAGEWGPLAFHADGTMSGIPKVSSGSVWITPVANTPTKATVTLPVGRFTNPPMVVATPYTGAPYTRVRGVGILEATATSFDVYVYRTDTVETMIHWIAVEGE